MTFGGKALYRLYQIYAFYRQFERNLSLVCIVHRPIRTSYRQLHPLEYRPTDMGSAVRQSYIFGLRYKDNVWALVAIVTSFICR